MSGLEHGPACESQRPSATRLNSAFCAIGLGRLHDLKVLEWCVLRSLIDALTICSVMTRALHERYLMEGQGDRLADVNVASVPQNGACAMGVVTVASGTMMPNPSYDGEATFNPDRTAYSTNTSASQAKAIGSLKWLWLGCLRMERVQWAW